ncbi:hypothetical protein [uncultured Photobacterium sp.]|uniref:hypothetical protein n=1 Tax=uncultured Photobacterium sp. TaxID=173973 RepID=UPI00263097A1|nr:hypothetical protein [uncultured Photobacterium sp.]
MVKKLQLSSSITVLYKCFLIPLLLLALPILWLVQVYVMLTDDGFSGNYSIVELTLGLMFLVLITSIYLKIKKVLLLEGGFLVTGFKSKKFIPFEQVKSIHGSILLYPELILMKVNDEDLGKYVIFIPKLRLTVLQLFTINPVVKELRAFITN